MITDESLMLKFQRGSRQAFEELFARYREPVHGFFRRRLDNNQRAEDLLQETFLAVIRATSRYEPRALFRTYLYGIALKLLASERRKQVTHNRSILSSPEPATEQTSDCTLWVREGLDRLDISEREVLMLREYEQLSYAEIAELLRIPVNTVRSRLFRARMSLRSNLESERELNGAAAAESGDKQDLKRTEGGV